MSLPNLKDKIEGRTPVESGRSGVIAASSTSISETVKTEEIESPIETPETVETEELEKKSKGRKLKSRKQRTKK